MVHTGYMSSVLSVHREQGGGRYATVLDWLFGPGKELHGSAANAMAQAVAALPEYREWLHAAREQDAKVVDPEAA